MVLTISYMGNTPLLEFRLPKPVTKPSPPPAFSAFRAPPRRQPLNKLSSSSSSSSSWGMVLVAYAGPVGTAAALHEDTRQHVVPTDRHSFNACQLHSLLLSALNKLSSSSSSSSSSLVSLPQERSTAGLVSYTWVARSRSGSSSLTASALNKPSSSSFSSSSSQRLGH